MSSTLPTPVSVTGRLVFKQAGPPRPLHNLSYEASVHLPLAPDRALGRGATDAEGRFSIALPEGRECVVRLRLLDHHRRWRDGEVHDEPVESGHVDLQVQGGGELGDVPVTWWPYRTDFPTPRAQFIKSLHAQAYSRGFQLTLAKAVAISEPPQLVLRGINALNHGKPSVADIQERQPQTLTLRVEAREPGRTRSDAWLADQLLNGFDIELRVGRDVEDPARLRAAIRWGELAAKGPYDLSDVDVVMEADEREVRATRITLRLRRPGADGAWASDETRTFTPADGEDWAAAKRVVRCQYLLHGALVGHITRAHFQTEMVATAAFRNLRANPIRHVLIPHLWEIVSQGKDGDNFAWGPEGILARSSALTTEYMYRSMAELSGSWDWSTFKPRAPLHATHRYAKAAALYWDMLQGYVRGAVERDRDGIVAHWVELRRFSDDLVARSVPYTPAPADPTVVPADHNELDDPSRPRAAVDGVVRAVRPLTTTDAPAEGELDALVQLCCFYIYQATFNHSWTHNGQYDAGGELAYAVFGLRNGSLGPEDDAEIMPMPAANIQSISTNTLGTRANYGFLIADEEQDVPPALRAAFQAIVPQLEALGVHTASVRSRINI